MKFSLILPMYGVEKYINRCLESLVNQSYKDFEVIIVDDCSLDSSNLIATKFCAKYTNFHYIKNESNQGLSQSRNNGLKVARGEYVLFLDTDDYYESNMLEIIYNSLKINNADVVLFGLVEEYRNKDDQIKFSIKHNVSESKYFNNTSFRDYIIYLEENTLYGYAWNKAYKRSILNQYNFQFINITHIEDIKFNIQVFNEITSLNILKDVLYHYDQHGSDRLTNKYISNYFELQKERIRDIKNQLFKWNKYNDNALFILSGIYHRNLISAIQRKIHHKEKVKLFLKEEYKNDLFLEFKGKYNNKSLITKFLYFIIDIKFYPLTILVVKLIDFTKSNFGMAFNWLKQNR